MFNFDSNNVNKKLFNFQFSDSIDKNQFIKFVTGKRVLLEDYKPLTNFKETSKSLGLNVLKSILIPANVMATNYNNHMYLIESGAIETEFDWKYALDTFYTKLFSSLNQNLSVFGISKALELIAVVNYPNLANKLTKSVHNSIKRKFMKFSRFEASRRIFSTNVYSSLLFHSSYLIYEFGSNIISYLQSSLSSRRIKIKILPTLYYISRETFHQIACLLGNAFGYSIGAYFDIQYIAPTLSFVFYTGSSIAYNNIMDSIFK
jgi:hypothetical protein